MTRHITTPAGLDAESAEWPRALAGAGPYDHDRPGSPRPARAAPPVLLGRQVFGIGLDKQLHKHRVHEVPPGSASLVPGPLSSESRHEARSLRLADQPGFALMQGM